MEASALKLDKALSIHGWMSPRELIWLAEQASHMKVIIEVGCFQGRSTRALADNTYGIVYAVDPWEEFYPDKDGNEHCIKANVYPQFYHNLKDLIDSGKVKPVKEYFTYFGQRADMIFLDGDHRADTLRHDIECAEKMINPGGIICGHDYTHEHWPGVKEVVDNHYNGKTVLFMGSIWSVKYD